MNVTKIVLSFFLIMSLFATAQQPALIPVPASLTVTDGYFILSSDTKLQVKTMEEKQAGVVLNDFLLKFHDMQIKEGKKKGNSIVLELDQNMNVESYELKVEKNGVLIRGGKTGLFYGIQTFKQLLTDKKQTEGLKIPSLVIKDEPRFKYRGLMLDAARHYFPVSFIKKKLDIMAEYKLNVFHWHLTDDQGWRIEIKKYPELTSIGAIRKQSMLGHQHDKPVRYDGIPYGGYYTKDEIKEIVAYAAERHITVIPEIDMPGHTQSALAAYSYLGCGDNPGPYQVSEFNRISEDVLCVGKESSYEFMQNVLDEVMELFPGEYIHIGGDECRKQAWKQCKHCQQRIKDNKLNNEEELQSYFIKRIEKYINNKGRRIIGWDEILEGGLAPDATVMSWRGVKGGIAAAQQNHDVIMSPNTFFYVDYAESTSNEEPLTYGRLLTLEKSYSFNPAPEELTPEQKKHIVGVQANLWSEYIKTPEKAFYMLFPRFFALAEVAWSPEENKNWKNFSEERLPKHLGWLDDMDISFRVPTPIGLKDTTINAASYTLECKVPVEGASVYYTIDGYQPTKLNFLYTEPVTIPVPAGEERLIKTAVVTKNNRRSITTTIRVVNQM